MKPAIVIVAFNRPQSLKRLLESIKNALYRHNDIDLIISIDYQESDGRKEVVKIANQFSWSHGEKSVINHSENLGLRKHVLSCGDLAVKYGSVILLEDDLAVSKQFYTYAQAALQFYNDDDKIGGISLYNHRRNPLNRLPFDIIPEDSSVYFLQFASSWGQAWTSKQWQNFRDWYRSAKISTADPIPEKVKKWPDSSWLKFFIKYLVATHKYFVYPAKSLTTNFADSGTHNKSKNTDFQVPLFMDDTMNSITMRELNNSINIYDSFFELVPDAFKRLYKGDHAEDLTIDLYGMKPIRVIKTEYLLSSKSFKTGYRGHSFTYGLQMKPAILNMVYNVQGEDIRLSKTESFEDNSEGIDISNNSVWDYFIFKLKPSIYLKIFANKVFRRLIKNK